MHILNVISYYKVNIGYILQNIKVANNLFLSPPFTCAFELEAKKHSTGETIFLKLILTSRKYLREMTAEHRLGRGERGWRGRKQRRRDATGAPPHNPPPLTSATSLIVWPLIIISNNMHKAAMAARQRHRLPAGVLSPHHFYNFLGPV